MTRTPKTVLAILTVGVASLALTGCSLLGNIVNNNSSTGSGSDSGEGTTTDVFAIGVGDCLNDGAIDGEVSEVLTIDCAQPHDSEAYAAIDMEGSSFPGEDVVADRAVTACTSEFTQFVGIDYNDSVLDFSYYYPTEDSWAQGDREILCLVSDPDGKSTGSFAGAAI